MRNMAVASALALTLMVPPAEAARARFEGHFLFTAKSGTCPFYDPVRSSGSVQFEPEISGSDNGPGSSFVLYQDLFAKGYRIAEGFGLFTSAFKDVDTMYMGQDFGPDDTATPAVRFTRQSPAAITLTTQTILITAQIRSFDFMPGCTVTVKMVFVKRIN
jgi:hypothetical protein